VHRLRFAAFMSAFSLAQAKPALVASAGAVAGAGGVVATWAHELELYFRLIAGFFGALGAFIAVLMVTPRFLRFLRAWRRRGLLSADQDTPPLQ
jgi:hypothetical protein